jgi:curved DNA-binding protein CbpA
MKTLYDLLGVRADADAEELRNAFRKAAKANHPDHHAGDRDAAIRFRQIVEAYDILRDADQRAAYDRLLKFERERFRRLLKGTVAYLVRNIVSDAIAVVGLAIVLGGGYTLFASISKTPIEAAKLVEATGRGPAKIAAVQPAARIDTTQDKPEGMAAPGTPFVLSAITSSTANDGSAPAVATRPADAKGAADRPDRTYGMRPLDQDKGQTADIRLSAPEKGDGVPKLFPSRFAMSDDKADVKTPDAPNINMVHAKIPEMKPPGRARSAARRQAASHTAFAQASPESRPACSGSCSGDAPPLFGVGF